MCRNAPPSGASWLTVKQCMRINTKIDVLPLVDKTLKAQKNLAFSTVQGINATARQIQAAQQQALQQNFTLRSKKDFLTRRIAVVKPWASVQQGRLFSEVAVNAATNGRSPLLLGGFEDGDERKPAKGKLIAQPVTGNSARPSFKDPVAQQFTFQAMKLKAKLVGGKKVYRGQSDTYTVAGVGVFRRTSKSDSELLYHFATRQRLQKKLGWERRAKDIADKWLSENITQAFLRSMPKKP